MTRGWQLRLMCNNRNRREGARAVRPGGQPRRVHTVQQCCNSIEDFFANKGVILAVRGSATGVQLGTARTTFRPSFGSCCSIFCLDAPPSLQPLHAWILPVHTALSFSPSLTFSFSGALKCPFVPFVTFSSSSVFCPLPWPVCLHVLAARPYVHSLVCARTCIHGHCHPCMSHDMLTHACLAGGCCTTTIGEWPSR